MKDIPFPDDGHWQNKHLNLLSAGYRKAPFFDVLAPVLDTVYQTRHHTMVDFNVMLIQGVRNLLGIATPVYRESELGDDFGDGSARNLQICRHFGAGVYLSGQGARSYNDKASFREAGIELVYQEFQHEPYEQGPGEFFPNLSILDMLCYLGPEATAEIVKRRCWTSKYDSRDES